MLSANEFTCFGLLPLELQSQIWREALSNLSICAATPDFTAGPPDLRPDGPSLAMSYVGTVPHIAALACTEAWRVFETLYGPPIRLADARLFWCKLDAAVVYLGNDFIARGVLNRFTSNVLCRLRHVALCWTRFDHLAKVCMRLSELCSSLETIVIQRCEVESAGLKALEPGKAGHYTSLLARTSCEAEDQYSTTTHIRSILLEYFAGAPPTIHILPPPRRPPYHGSA